MSERKMAHWTHIPTRGIATQWKGYLLPLAVFQAFALVQGRRGSNLGGAGRGCQNATVLK